MSKLEQGTKIAAALTLALAALTAAPGMSAADSGPDTCLNGYVWRQANPTDHVCVTPAIRTQTAADNAQAASRRNPAGGASGPDTCLQGFVWRDAFADDHVCVTPAARTQAAADDAAAAGRRDRVQLTLFKYTPPQTPCDGDTCTSTPDAAARWRAVGDHMNLGKVRLFLRSANGKKIASWTLTATKYASRPGGRISFQTGRLVCPGTTNGYFQLQDLTSGRLSPKRAVRTGCATL
jgi:hypothetical protein